MSHSPAPQTGKVMQRPILTQSSAQVLIDAAHRHATDNGLKVSVAIVDQAGHLLAFARMDDVHLGTVEVACAKARTAALFKKNTADLADAVASGNHALLSLLGLVAVPGGMTLSSESFAIGAIGISGATPQQDADIAKAAINASTGTGD